MLLWAPFSDNVEFITEPNCHKAMAVIQCTVMLTWNGGLLTVHDSIRLWPTFTKQTLAGDLSWNFQVLLGLSGLCVFLKKDTFSVANCICCNFFWGKPYFNFIFEGVVYFFLLEDLINAEYLFLRLKVMSSLAQITNPIMKRNRLAGRRNRESYSLPYLKIRLNMTKNIHNKLAKQAKPHAEEEYVTQYIVQS